MDITASILHHYPTAVPSRDFTVRDDSNGKGPYLDQWSLAGEPRPMDADLTAWWNDLQANPPAAPADVDGLEVALHTSTEFTTAMLVALYADPSGAALLPFITVAAKTGDWTHAQAVYNDLRDAATLPAGWTKQQIVDLMTLANKSYGIQITP